MKTSILASTTLSFPRQRMTLPTLLLCVATACSVSAEEGFMPLMDGKTFTGWTKSTENPGTWKIEDGAFVADGPRSHLFYSGAEQPFKNFHLKMEVMTEANSNGGIFFHTEYQESDWPRIGFESQVNVTHSDWIKTGSLYGLVNIGVATTEDRKWWTQEIIVQDRSVTVIIDGKRLFQYIEPAGAQKKLNQGTFALQGHDPKSVIRYRNIRVKRL